MTFEILIEKLPPHLLLKLEKMKELRERPDYHPEKSAYEHIKIVTERLITTDNPDLICSGIFHDIHKGDCAKINPKTGYPTSPGHDSMAETTLLTNVFAQEFCKDLGANPERVAAICAQHMRYKQFPEMKPSKRKTFMEMEIFEDLEIFGRADDMLKEFTL